MATELGFAVEAARQLHRRISVLQSFGVIDGDAFGRFQFQSISGDGGEYGVVSGEIFGRSVTSSFCAIGECPSPASQVFADDDGSLAADLDDLLGKSLILPVVLLFALGRDLLCSPVSFSFRVRVVGCGISGGLLIPVGGGSATLCSGDVELLELALPLPPMVSSLISFQWLKSISTGGLGWWFLRLFQVLEAAGGGAGSGCFNFSPGAGESEFSSTNRISEKRKTNRSSSYSFVFFSSSGSFI